MEFHGLKEPFCLVSEQGFCDTLSPSIQRLPFTD